ncbi:MAG: hypothetical protein ABSG81_06605 [Acidimicrobiales bacterium]
MTEPVVDVVGELLFGRRLRLRVMLWVAEQTAAFNQSEAARGVGYNSSGEVAKELERLVSLDMVRKYGRPGRVGPQNYLRAEHLGWGVVEAARRMVEMAQAEAETADDPPRPQSPGAGFEVLEVLDSARRPTGIGRDR